MSGDRETQAAADAHIPAVLHDDWCRPYIPASPCYCTARERLADIAGQAYDQIARQAQRSIGVSLLHGEQPCDCPGPVCAGEALAW